VMVCFLSAYGLQPKDIQRLLQVKRGGGGLAALVPNWPVSQPCGIMTALSLCSMVGPWSVT
jgi:hypothetical protein